MDTLAKGNAFEDLVFDIIEKELENDRLGLSPSQARLFKKKGYFSKDRKSKIIVDIAIEVWPPNSKNYSFLWVCECKDYGGTIPVDDVEEFKAKLDQIAGKNVKGVIASPNALQKGAFSYARSNGIGVVRVLPHNQVDWVISYMTAGGVTGQINPSEFTAALLNANHRGRSRSFYSVCDEYCFGDWYSLISHTLKVR
jgi:hypothetical protein